MTKRWVPQSAFLAVGIAFGTLTDAALAQTAKADTPESIRLPAVIVGVGAGGVLTDSPSLRSPKATASRVRPVPVRSSPGGRRRSRTIRLVARTRSGAELARQRADQMAASPETQAPAVGRRVCVSFATGDRKTAEFVGVTGTELLVREDGLVAHYPIANTTLALGGLEQSHALNQPDVAFRLAVTASPQPPWSRRPSANHRVKSRHEVVL